MMSFETIGESGQAFRWAKCSDGYILVASGHLFLLRQIAGGLKVASPSTGAPGAWATHYFDLDTDYTRLCERLSRCDPAVASAVQFAPGLRLLRQEPWEVLISFICSQNNNIPRIRQLVERIAHGWGKKETSGDYSWWCFPTPQDLSKASITELEMCGVGYRARGILEAAQKVADGRLSLEELMKMPTALARERLLELYGVGRKVADCVLLFGLGKLDSFPIDVWIKRGLEQNYFAGEQTALKELHEFAKDRFPEDAGYAQNYLFYHTRSSAKRKQRRG